MPRNVMCKKCNNYRNQWCEMVIDSPDPDIVRDCRHFWLKTNADRIRAMTDEELAVFLRTVEYDVDQFPFIQDWDKWLKEQAEGDA